MDTTLRVLDVEGHADQSGVVENAVVQWPPEDTGVGVDKHDDIAAIGLSVRVELVHVALIDALLWILITRVETLPLGIHNESDATPVPERGPPDPVELGSVAFRRSTLIIRRIIYRVFHHHRLRTLIDRLRKFGPRRSLSNSASTPPPSTAALYRRGLDIYQTPQNWFEVGVNDVSLRKCFETNVDFYRAG